MRKLVAATVIAVAVALSVILTSCGGPSLTSVQAKAVKDVNALLVSFDVKPSSPTVVGTVDKDGQGNKVTLVHETFQGSNAQGKAQTYDLILIVVTTPDGKLVFADALLPSGLVTVQGQ